MFFSASELRDVPDDATDEDKLIVLFRKLQLLESEKREASVKLKQADKRVLSVRWFTTLRLFLIT